MGTAKTGHLTVPGASLYYEVRGSGPVLLLIPTGNGDGGPYTAFAEAMSHRHTVITYDKRAYSRSRLEGPTSDPVASDVDDAHRLLDHFADAPAHAFGSSSGGIVALELLTKHPEQLSTSIVHEPPLASVLEDSEDWLGFFTTLYESYQQHGPKAAMAIFRARMGMSGTTQPPDEAQLPPDELADMLDRIRRNHTLWFELEVPNYPGVVPDIATLKGISDKLILAGGDISRGDFPYQPNRVLSQQLGVEITHFPGGHVGFVTHPYEFADAMVDLLATR
jgi:acetyltransferase/esterase